MKPAAKMGRPCPHCGGIGRVFVYIRGYGPVYRQPIKHWNDRVSHDCGMCGGDGWIDPSEDWDAYNEWVAENEKPHEAMPKA